MARNDDEKRLSYEGPNYDAHTSLPTHTKVQIRTPAPRDHTHKSRTTTDNVSDLDARAKGVRKIGLIRPSLTRRVRDSSSKSSV
jgi:hypothetical protein